MFLLETKNLTKIVKGYNKKSELHVSPAGVRVGASAWLRVSCVGTSRHQKGTKALASVSNVTLFTSDNIYYVKRAGAPRGH